VTKAANEDRARGNRFAVGGVTGRTAGMLVDTRGTHGLFTGNRPRSELPWGGDGFMHLIILYIPWKRMLQNTGALVCKESLQTSFFTL
jgi:hypothetical protein